MITVSHEVFGAGRAVAQQVAEMLGYRCVSREVLIRAQERYGIAAAKLSEVLEEKPHHWWEPWFESRRVYRIAVQAALCEIAQEGKIVYHGRAGQEFFPGIRHVLNVFVESPTQSRIQEIMTRKGLGPQAARQHLESTDAIHARRIRELFKIDWRDPSRYDLVLNTSRTTVKTAASIIAELSQCKEYQPTAESLQAMEDLTLRAKVEALLTASRMNISDLYVEARCGEVHVGGTVLAEALKETASEAIRTVPGVARLKTFFVITTPDEYLYGDGR
jgi:cytidylate kinase